MTDKENLVLRVYKEDSNLVNSDKDLIPAVWRLEGWSDGRSLEDNFRRVSNPESITRARRKLHEQGTIKYSKQSEDKRYEQFKEKREEYGIPGFPKDVFEGFPKVEIDEGTNTVRLF